MHSLIGRPAFCVAIFIATANCGAGIDGPRSNSIIDNAGRLREAIDAVVTNRMQEFHVPGAVVTVVKGEKVIFNEGYGLANLEEHRPVDPEKTLFRVASVSKVFNAMATLKLVDKGLIAPDEDVRPRLSKAGFELDNSADGPVTLRALLTHTAGIRDMHIPGLTLATNAASLLPLRQYLQKCLPLRWQNSGETMLYSDHGITLAGYVIEVVSKTKFQDFVQSMVMRPLGMTRTCYAVANDARADVAIAYSYGDSGYSPTDFRYANIDPAIGVLTTGRDMGRLIIAHLSGKGFLKRQTVKLMHESQYSDDPRLGIEWTCGFWQMRSIWKEPYLFHYGGACGFVSQVLIMPSRDVGFFVSQNRDAPLVFQIGDLEGLLGTKSNRSKPTPAKLPPAISIDSSHLEALTGTYVGSRMLSRGVPLKDEYYVHVKYVEEIHGIEITHWRNRDKPMRLVEVEPLFFRSAHGNKVSFRRSRDGRDMYLFDFNFSGDGQFKRISPGRELPPQQER